MALVLRRLLRLCRLHGADPQVICCSATIGQPLAHALRLVPLAQPVAVALPSPPLPLLPLPREVVCVDRDGSPSAPRTFLVWNPPLVARDRVAEGPAHPAGDAASAASDIDDAGDSAEERVASAAADVDDAGDSAEERVCGAAADGAPGDDAEAVDAAPPPAPTRRRGRRRNSGTGAGDGGDGDGERPKRRRRMLSWGPAQPSPLPPQPSPQQPLPPRQPLPPQQQPQSQSQSQPQPVRPSRLFARRKWRDTAAAALDRTNQRRSAALEAARLLAALVQAGARTLLFCRTRRVAEITLRRTRDMLIATDGSDASVEAEETAASAASRGRELAGRVAAYRSGYPAPMRRELEQRLQSGEVGGPLAATCLPLLAAYRCLPSVTVRASSLTRALCLLCPPRRSPLQLLGLVATNALELGIDVGCLDATVLLGFPSSVASMWQQAGRAGRGLRPGLTILCAFDAPLDQVWCPSVCVSERECARPRRRCPAPPQYFVRRPSELFERPVEVRTSVRARGRAPDARRPRRALHWM